MKHYSVFMWRTASGIDSVRASVFSVDVLSDGISRSFEEILK